MYRGWQFKEEKKDVAVLNSKEVLLRMGEKFRIENKYEIQLTFLEKTWDIMWV